MLADFLVGLGLVVDDVAELVAADFRSVGCDVDCDVDGEGVVGFSTKEERGRS